MISRFRNIWLPNESRQRGLGPIAANRRRTSGGGGGAPTEFLSVNTLGAYGGGPNDTSGMMFTVGASPITVTEVAILGNAGHYSATIPVILYTAAGVEIDRGVPTWGTSNATWYWAALASARVLLPGTSYCLCAPWAYNDIYNYNTTVTPTAAATINGSTYGINNIQIAGNRCEGPLNFKYTT